MRKVLSWWQCDIGSSTSCSRRWHRFAQSDHGGKGGWVEPLHSFLGDVRSRKGMHDEGTRPARGYGRVGWDMGARCASHSTRGAGRCGWARVSFFTHAASSAPAIRAAISGSRSRCMSMVSRHEHGIEAIPCSCVEGCEDRTPRVIYGMHCRCTLAVTAAAWKVWVGLCRGLLSSGSLSMTSVATQLRRSVGKRGWYVAPGCP
jgi:hypothetical protein